MNKFCSFIKSSWDVCLIALMIGLVALSAIVMLIGFVCKLSLLISIGYLIFTGSVPLAWTIIGLTYVIVPTINNWCMSRTERKKSASALNHPNKERSTKKIAQVLTKEVNVGWDGMNLSEYNLSFVCFSNHVNLNDSKVQNTVMVGASQRQADGSYLTLKKLKETAPSVYVTTNMVTTAKELEKALESQLISLKRAQTLLTFFMQMKDLMTDQAFLKQRPDIEQNQAEYKEEISGAITVLSTFVAKKVREEVEQTSQRAEKSWAVDKTLSTEKGIKACSYKELVFKANHYLPREIHSQIFAKTFASSYTVPVVQKQLYQQSLMKDKASSWSEKPGTSFVSRVRSFFAGKKEDSTTPLVGRV